MTAAEDLHRRRETETALHRLIDGRAYTRKGLFSRIERWQEQLLKRLLSREIIEAAGRSNSRGNPVMYQMKDEQTLRSILENEDQLLQMVFPSYKPAPQLDEVTPMLTGTTPADEPSEPDAFDDAMSAESLEEALASSDVMSTEILLKLLLGMIELLNSHTDQLNDLSERVTALDEKVSKLLQELTG